MAIDRVSPLPDPRRGTRRRTTGPATLAPLLRPAPEPFPVPARSTGKGARAQLHEAVRQIIVAGGPTMVFQPQLSLSRLEISGYEALARFPEESIPQPDHWFKLARDVGLAAELEACAVARALECGPRPEGTWLAVNVSPAVLGSAPLCAALPRDLTGIEIELTEHEGVDRRHLRRELDRLRERGARLAIDDVGAGHSSLHRCVELSPDTLKLDRALVEGVTGDGAKIALIRAVVDFAADIGATVCAEGVERLDDLLTLADLDVEYAQGWAVGLPAVTFASPDPAIVAAGRRSRRHLLAARTPAAPSTVADLGGLLAEVADVTSLASVVSLAAGALECDVVTLSRLRPADHSVVDLTGGRVRDLGGHAAVRTCLENRLVVPMDVATGGPLGIGENPGVLLAPVVSRGRAIGVLECHQTGEAPFSRRQIRAARFLGTMIGPVLESLHR